MARQIILDTETTGLSPVEGHRIIEIGCIEVIDRRTTGNHFHQYINPQRNVDEGAFKVHGLGNDFLSDKPLFANIVHEFLEFIKGSELLIHNAVFDVGFINSEFERLGLPKLQTICKISDTLEIARQKHPGQRNSLDALCKRYQVDATDRVFHGALLDAQLLADVYLNMTAGQNSIEFNDIQVVNKEASLKQLTTISPVIYATDEEIKLHQEFLAIIKKKSDKCLWETLEG